MEITDEEFYEYIDIGDLEKTSTKIIEKKMKKFSLKIHPDKCNYNKIKEIFKNNKKINEFIDLNRENIGTICNKIFQLFNDKRDEIIKKLENTSEPNNYEYNIDNNKLIQNVQNILDVLFFRIFKLLEIISKEFPKEFETSVENLDKNVIENGNLIKGGMSLGFINFFIIILITIFNTKVKANILNSLMKGGVKTFDTLHNINIDLEKASDKGATIFSSLVSNIGEKTVQVLNEEIGDILKQMNEIKSEVETKNEWFTKDKKKSEIEKINETENEMFTTLEKEELIKLNNKLLKLKQDYSSKLFASSIIESSIVSVDENKSDYIMSPYGKTISDLFTYLPKGENIASFNSMFTKSLDKYWQKYCVDIGNCVVAETPEDIAKLYITPYLKEVESLLEVIIPQLKKFAENEYVSKWNKEWLEQYSKRIGTDNKTSLLQRTTSGKKKIGNIITTAVSIGGLLSSGIGTSIIAGLSVNAMVDGFLYVTETPSKLAHYVHLTLNTAEHMLFIIKYLNILTNSNNFLGTSFLSVVDFFNGIPLTTIISKYGKSILNITSDMITEMIGISETPGLENILIDFKNSFYKDEEYTITDLKLNLKNGKITEEEYNEIVDLLLVESIKSSSQLIGLSGISENYLGYINNGNFQKGILDIVVKTVKKYKPLSNTFKKYDEFINLLKEGETNFKEGLLDLAVSGEILGGEIQNKKRSIKKKPRKKIPTIKKYSKW